MPLRFLSVAFADPPDPASEIARLTARGTPPDFTVVLKASALTARLGFRVVGPDHAPGAVTAAQELSAFCQSRALPVVLDLAPPGPDAPSGGSPVVELLPGGNAQTAERLGAAVREFLERDTARSGVVAVLPPPMRQTLAAALADPVAHPLPSGSDPALACALHLLPGLPPLGPRGVTAWRR